MKSRKIAIIDEDKKVIGELKEILSLCGYIPVPIIDPLSAVGTFILNKPDLILMELGMPQQSGFELARTINRVFETNKVPIIGMSDSYKDEYRWLLDFCGIKKWIKKPLQPLNLIWAIENELEQGNQWSMENRLAEMETVA